MTWTEASGTYWMAVLIMGVLGYIKQKELLWRNADQRRRVYTRNPILPCDYLGAFSLGEFWGYLLQVFGTPMPVFAGKILHRRPDRDYRRPCQRPGGPMGVVDGCYITVGRGNFCGPLVLWDECV